MRIIILIITIIVVSIFLSILGLDFFAGFLLVFELPVLLIASIFYFHKHGVKFDTIYDVNLSFKDNYEKNILFCSLFFVLLYIFVSNGVVLMDNPNGVASSVFNNIFVYNIQDHIYSGFRNDFLIWYTTLYVDQPTIVIYLGFMIFIASFLIIIIYYIFKAHNLVKRKKDELVLIQRKQQLNKQAIYNNKLSFFLNKVYTKKTDKFLEFLELKEKVKLEAEKLIKDLSPYKKIRKVKTPSPRAYWFYEEDLQYDKIIANEPYPIWTELMFDIRLFGNYDEELNDFFLEETVGTAEAREYRLTHIL